MANQIIDTQIIQAGVETKLAPATKLLALAKVVPLTTPGSTITVPRTAYIGDAEKVAPGAMIPIADFAQSHVDVDVNKYGKGVVFTQEDVQNSYIDVNEEAERQLIQSVTSGMEKDMYASLRAIGASMTHSASAFDVANIGDALVKFGEDLDEEMFLLVSPANFAKLRKDPNFIVKSSDTVDSVGQIYGCTVVVSGNVAANEAFIMKFEALGVFLRKDVEVKYQEEIANETHLVTGTAYAGVYLRDESKAIKITVAAG